MKIFKILEEKISKYNITETKEDLVEVKEGIIYPMTTSDNQNIHKNINSNNKFRQL